VLHVCIGLRDARQKDQKYFSLFVYSPVATFIFCLGKEFLMRTCLIAKK
jgi:hypothetical protein